MLTRWIYHLSRKVDWDADKRGGRYEGPKEDRADGFLHFSAASWVVERARRHRIRETALLLLEVDAYTLIPNLKSKTFRGGDLFPLLYGSLHAAVAASEFELSLGPNGLHLFTPIKAFR